MQATHESYAGNTSSSASKSRENLDMKGAQFVVQSNLKIIARSIAALSKMSEDVLIEVSDGGLFLKVVHRSKFCVFRFAPEFFNTCDVSMINKRAVNICRLSMKSAQRIFKGVSLGDKNFVGCEFRIDPKGEKMLINLEMNYDIHRVIHAKLREMSNVLQKPVYDRALCRNTTVLFASTLLSILAPMKNDVEVTMKVDEEGVTFRNYHSSCGTTSYNGSEFRARKKVKTEATLGVDKVSRHEVSIEVEFSFSLKEVMAIALFADQLGSEVCLYYDLPGRPMVLSIESHPNFDVELALPTIGNEDEVDLDGGIVTETLGRTESESAEDVTKRRNSEISESIHCKKKVSAEKIDITSSGSPSTSQKSKPKRGPIQTQERHSSESEPSKNKFNKAGYNENTTVPVAERSWRDNEVLEEEQVQQPQQQLESTIPEEQEVQVMEELMEVDPRIEEEEQVVGRNDVEDVTTRVRENCSISPVTIEDDQEEEEPREDDAFFRVPEPKRKKVDENRNKKIRRILMGTSRRDTIRMSQQFTGNPLAFDTQK